MVEHKGAFPGCRICKHCDYLGLDISSWCFKRREFIDRDGLNFPCEEYEDATARLIRKRGFRSRWGGVRLDWVEINRRERQNLAVSSTSRTGQEEPPGLSR